MTDATAPPAPPVACGPLAHCTARFDALEACRDVRLLYADLAGLAERDALRRRLGLPAGDAAEATELLRHAYQRWGPACVEHLGGAFAFAVWDGRSQALVLARDPLGLCPLYVARLPGAVVAGGDLRRLLAAGVSDEWDWEPLTARLLDPQYVPPERTCFRAIRSVRAGHLLFVEPHRKRAERYWQPERVPEVRFRHEGDYVDAFRTLLREVVRDHLPATGRVGVHLSGGLDSSGVAAFAAAALREAGREAPPAFAWHTPPGDAPTDEHRLIEAAAAGLGLALHYTPVTAAGVVAFYRRDATRDPYTSTLLHEQEVQQAAAALGVDVILSGWGGDEAATFSGRGAVEPYLLRTGRWRPLLRAGRAAGRSPGRTLLHAALRRPRPDTSPQHQRRAVLRGASRSYVHPDLVRDARLPPPDPAPQADPYAYIRWLLGRGHLGERTAGWALAGAERGLHYRYPLLDRRIVRFVLGLPPELWLPREGRRRWLARTALAGLVPDAVLLHTSKLEPARISAVTESFVRGCATLAGRLRQPPLPSRSAWFDLPRLTDTLASEPLVRQHRSGKLLHALAYLDL